MRIILLVIDIGNTNIVFGLYKGNDLIYDWRISTDKEKTSDEYGLLFKQIFDFALIDIEEIKDIIISSVVPNLMYTIPAACERYIGKTPIVVTSDTNLGISNRYNNPKEVGADRLVTGVAAFEKFGGPVIIVDIGTAVTVDYINEKGEYLGGAIAPGIGIASEALFMKTAKLPKVELVTPDNAIGKTTKESIQSGMVFGYIGLIDNVIKMILEEMNLTKDKVKIIGTGGYARLISLNSEYIEEVDKMLTLEGLRIIYEKNRK